MLNLWPESDWIKDHRFLKITAGILLVLLAGQLLLYGLRAPEPTRRTVTVSPIWVSSPKTLRDAIDLAEVILVAKVKTIQHARHTTGPPDRIKKQLEQSQGKTPGGNPKNRGGPPELSAEVPSEVVRLRTQNVLKGNPGKAVEIYHLGHSYKFQADRRKTTKTVIPLTRESPPYRRGSRYLLFLTDGPTIEVGGKQKTVLRPIAPEGRFRITPQGLQPVVNRHFSGDYRGAPPGKLIGAIQRILHGSNNNEMRKKNNEGRDAEHNG